MVWRKGDEMTSDIFTKNLPLQVMERHGKEFYGEDEYHHERYTENKDSNNNKARAKEAAKIVIKIGKEAFKAYTQYKEIFATLIDSSQPQRAPKKGRMLACETINY